MQGEVELDDARRPDPAEARQPEPPAPPRRRGAGDWLSGAENGAPLPGDAIVRALILLIEYAIVASLVGLAGIVLVRTFDDFVTSSAAFPDSVVPAVDGILVVIILLDIVQTVFRHLRSAEFPVRPFLVIGILAGVREILSASAHLTLVADLSSRAYTENVVELGVGVGVVVALLAGLLFFDRSRPHDADR